MASTTKSATANGNDSNTATDTTSSSSSSSISQQDTADLSGVLMKGWFSEVNNQWPGMACSIAIEEKLFDERSDYQHVQVYKTKTWGNMLVLDGVIQLTTRDEMSYQEMMAHIPLYAHNNPKDVLVIGGGDGGIIREICKHSGVEHITICEIDKVVIEAGKKYFPSVASAWSDSRVELYVGDGNEFMKRAENKERYDVIITDSSDPVGPAQALFESPFYQAMYHALKPSGRVCTQAESIWNNLDLIQKLVKDSLHIYQTVEYASVQTPTYPAGQIGFLLCTKAGQDNKSHQQGCSTPSRKIPSNEQSNYRFYTSSLHAASFVHPAFVERAIEDARQEYAKENQETKKQKTKAS